MADVTLRKVVKKYDDVEAVRGIDLDIADHEFVVLVGPSGCGKSTTLRMIAGLEDITGGDIMIGGDVVNDVPPKDRDIAMVFQNYALYPHMTVAENMSFGLRLKRYPKAEIKTRIDEAARMLDIVELVDRKPKQLSGGQRQRVGIARAIVRGPRVLLMDEPLSNLDTKLRAEMRAELAALQRQIGATTIYVTHDQTEALSLADHLIVMRDGVIEQQGSPGDVFRYPATAFIADFLGSMNLIHARSEGRAIRFGTGGDIVLPPGQELPLGEQVILGFRAEDIRTAPLASSCISFNAEVLRTELLGSDSLVYLSVAGETIRARLATTARTGDRLALFIDEANIHCFSADGRRIDQRSRR